MSTNLRKSTNSRFAFPVAVAAAAAVVLASAMLLGGAGRFGRASGAAAAEPANARPASSLAVSDRRQAVAAGRPAAERAYAWDHPSGGDLTATLEASR